MSRFDEGTQTVLTGDPSARNTLSNPDAIVPATHDLSGLTVNSKFTFPGSSVSVIRLVGALGTPGVPPTSTSEDVDVGGTVPATLSLSLGPAARFPPLVPGLEHDYLATSTAKVLATSGDARLSAADASATASGHLVNGAFALPSPLLVGGSALPAVLKTWSAPVSNDPVALEFSQHVGADDALRTGSYAKTITFTLSTTTP